MALFPLVPDRVTKLKRRYKTTIIEFENQTDQRFANDHVGKRFFRLDWDLMLPADFAALDSFFHQHLGAFRKFQINDSRIAAAQVDVRFEKDEYEATPIKGDRAYKVSVEIRTC